MTRIHSAYVKYLAGKELDAYLTQRAWNWLTNQNYAIAADYVIHLLNRHSRAPLALMMGMICARHTNQEEFYIKCKEAVRNLCYTIGVNNIIELLHQCSSHEEDDKSNITKCGNESSPSLNEVLEWLRDNECTEHFTELLSTNSNKKKNNSNIGNNDSVNSADDTMYCNEDETIHVMESESLEETQRMVQTASSRAQCTSTIKTTATRSGVVTPSTNSSMIELCSPQSSMYGRGLYASKSIRAWTSLMLDEPCAVQRISEQRCAYCLAQLQSHERLHKHVDLEKNNIINDDDVEHRRESNTPTDETLVQWGLPCLSCHEETYCSEACREAAWSAYHCCCCRSHNPSFADWAAEMYRNMKHVTSSPEESKPITPMLDSTSQLRASLSCLAVAKIIAMATVKQTHPLQLPCIRALRGQATYSPQTALAEIGSLAVALGTFFRQSHLYMEEVLSLFAVWQTNEFVIANSGVALYPLLSLLNHSCTPNCVIVSRQNTSSSSSSSGQRELVALRDIRTHEQLFIDYNACYNGTLSYDDRKALCAQRHFECFCAKCVKKE